LLRRAGEWFERVGVPYELARTKALLAQVLPDGDAALAEAIASAEHLFGPEAAVQPQPERPDDRASGPGTPAGLSPREREILVRLAEGRTNQEVAEELVLSLRTVERHVSNIYLKLGFEGRTARAAAVSFAHRAGLAGRLPD
jgi:DNA-binding NarL/FixJ family response regulator